MAEKTLHEGRNVNRIRDVLGIKQDALAMELGLSQPAGCECFGGEGSVKRWLRRLHRC